MRKSEFVIIRRKLPFSRESDLEVEKGPGGSDMRSSDSLTWDQHSAADLCLHQNSYVDEAHNRKV